MNVLLVTDGLIHPPLIGRLALHRALRRVPGLSFRHIPSLEHLPADLSDCAALVLYYHHRTISAGALDRLDDFVRSGGGVLALHSATASFKDCPRYAEILGGRFVGHPPVQRLELRRVRDDIFGEIEPFVVEDELYFHELRPPVTIHFVADHQGEEVPVVWTRHYGRGRVCYAVPGHTASSMSNETYQRLLQRALLWVTE
ncbi:MAG: ThuA domain-containing protein [Anaerolineae bacterium]|nr:ThuA domain-containing protein [Anaerolineae bacterium]